MPTKAVFLVLLFPLCFSHAIEVQQKGADVTATDITADSLMNQADATFQYRDYKAALEQYQSVVNKAREEFNHSGEVAKLFSDYHIGMTYRLLGQYDRAGQWLRPVLAWAERTKNHSAVGQACADLAEIEIAQGRKAEGLILLKRARSEYKLEGFDKSWPEIWNHINERIKELEE